jgi:hypothetical protein
VSIGLSNCPTFPFQKQIDCIRANQLLENHQHPYSSKLPGKHSATIITPKPHLAEGHCLQSWLCKLMVKFVKQKHAANTKAECECILYSTNPTLEQRLAAIPFLTYTSIISKLVLLNFEKLMIADLIRIFKLKSEATLKRLDIFESFQMKEEVSSDHIKNLWCLIERLTHLKRSLKDTSSVQTKEEFQEWNYRLKYIGGISVVEHGVYPVFYSVFPLFLPVLLSPLEAFLAFAQSKCPSQRLTMCALLPSS